MKDYFIRLVGTSIFLLVAAPLLLGSLITGKLAALFLNLEYFLEDVALSWNNFFTRIMEKTLNEKYNDI